MAKPVYVDVEPELLEWAVERAGWDFETACDKFPKYEEWITGEKKPTLNQLQKFATKTHAPFGMLFLPEPPVEKIPIPDMRTMKNHRLTQPSGDLLDTIYTCQQRQDWYKDYAEELGLEELSFINSASIQTEPEKVAKKIRKLLRFELDDRKGRTREDMITYLTHQIEDLGVLVMRNSVVGSNTQRRLQISEFRGFSLCDPIAPLIFVNTADTKSGQIFTIIHELAHLFLGHSALSDANIIADNGNDEEIWCNKVAAEALVPVEALKQDYRKILCTEEYERLSKKYCVSTLVILKSLYDADFLNWITYQEEYSEESERINRLLEAQKIKDKEKESKAGYYNTQLSRLGSRFADAVIVSTYEGTTTFRDAYSLLGTKTHKTFEGLVERLQRRAVA